MVELSICVLHYNHWGLTKDCLASIDAQEIPCSYEKVLVDNGSTLRLQPETIPTGWRLVSYPDNWGHIKGQNRCFESAQGEWVLFVANDVRLYYDCIKPMWLLRQNFGVLQTGLDTPEGLTDNFGLQWRWPGYGLSYKHVVMRPDAFTSTLYLMTKRLWKYVGGFDESLQSSHEDIDFSLSLKQAREQAYCLPTIGARHLGNATLRHQSSHNRAAFHRDRVYVIRKHYVGINRALRLAAVYLLDAIPRP